MQWQRRHSLVWPLTFTILVASCQQPPTEPPVAESQTQPPTNGPTSTPYDPCAPIIRVLVWEDLDGDGVRDTDEPPLPGIDVFVVDNTDPSRNTVGEQTSADGLADIAVTLTDECALTERFVYAELPQGFTHTTDNVVTLAEFDPQNAIIEVGMARIPNYVSPTPWPTGTPTVFPPPVTGGLVPTLDPLMFSQRFEDCPYVSRDEAEEILGEPVQPSPENPIAGASFMPPDLMDGFLYCAFTTPTQIALLNVWVAESRQQAQSHFDAHQAVAGGQAIAVSGLGDEAFWWPLALRLDVRYLNARLWVNFDRPGRDQADQAAALAASALEAIDSTLGEVRPAPVVVPASAPTPQASDIISRSDLETGAEPFDACTLLSVAEFESVLGALESPPQNTSGIGELVGIVDGCLVNGISYSIYIAGTPSGAYFTFLPDPAASPVEGIGDAAWYVVTDEFGATLVVVRGNIYFGFSSYRQDAASDRPGLEELARLVVERLFERAR